MRETQAIEGDIFSTDEEEDLNLERIRPPLNMVRFLLGLSPLSENSLNSASTQTEANAGESP